MVAKNFVHTVKTSLTKVKADLLKLKNVLFLDATDDTSEKVTVKSTTNNWSEPQKAQEPVVSRLLRNGKKKVLLCVKCFKTVKSTLFPERGINSVYKKFVQLVPRKEVTKKHIWELLKESDHNERCDGHLHTVGWDNKIKNYISQCDKCKERLFVFYIDKPNGNNITR